MNMKKLLIITLIIFSAAIAFAGTQSARSDANRNSFWVAPRAIVTIAADTAVSTDYLAIVPMTDVSVYLGTDSGNTFTILAYTVLTLPLNQDLKLATETKCMAF